MSHPKLKTLECAVVGAGYVGIPLACLVAKAGLGKVWVLDIDSTRIAKLNEGIMPIEEEGVSQLFKSLHGKGLIASSDISEGISSSDVVIITVGTPLDPFFEPDIEPVLRVAQLAIQKMKRHSLLMLRSTVPVGTTAKLRDLIAEHRTLGDDLGLAYCPERSVESKAIRTMTNFPTLIGTYDKVSQTRTLDFFKLVGFPIASPSDPETVEMAKLMCNAYRAANIALGNEFSLICETLGINAHEAIRLANTSPLVDIMRPGLVGGSCLTKDPYFILKSAKENGLFPKVLLAAKELNEALPAHGARLIIKALANRKIPVSQANIVVLGIAFKGNTNDMRQSPVVPLIMKLVEAGVKTISVYDPYVSPDQIAKLPVRVLERIDEDKGADCIVLGAEHSVFLQTDFLKWQSSEGALVIDMKGILPTAIGLGVPVPKPQ